LLIYVLKMKWWIPAFLTVLAAIPCQAEIYKWRLPDGSIEYSDRPPEEGAKRVELPPLTTYTPPAAAARAATSEGKSAAVFDGYDSFTITSPADDATVRDNAGNVDLKFDVTPTLVEGHAIDIFMDGRKFGRSTASIVTLSNVSRGTHQIYAAIVDEAGAELARTLAINIDLLRASDILSDEEKPPDGETPFDQAIKAKGGPTYEDPNVPGRKSGGPVYADPNDPGRESGGAASQDPEDPDPGRKRRSGGAKSVDGPKSPGGVRPQFGATLGERRPPPTPAPSVP
jgi:hypothetical protein